MILVGVILPDELNELFESINQKVMKEDEEKLNLFLKTLEISKSGYAGMLPNGNIVDRREHPEAMPIEKNNMFEIPKPIKL